MSTITFTKSSNKTYYTVSLLGEQVGTIEPAINARNHWKVYVNDVPLRNNANEIEFTLGDAKKRANQYSRALLTRSLQPLSKPALIEIHKSFREKDKSHLPPVSNRFNATERAIRRLRVSRQHGEFTYVVEYIDALENEISAIVNDAI